MNALCKYWVGDIPNTCHGLMNTVVVMTSIPITRSKLKNTYNNVEITLKKVKKKNSDLLYTYVVFEKEDKGLFCSEDLRRSCILKTILHLYHNKNNIEDEFRDKLHIYHNKNNVEDEFRDKLHF